jgi:predicted enzyme related to lactoylglutathione lyase
MLKHVMFATVYVSDQDRALAFYTQALGLEKGGDNSAPEGRFLTVAPEDKSVQIVLWKADPGQSPAVRAATGPIFLATDDLRRDFELFRSRGVEFLEPEPIHYSFGVRATALDPDGNRIELRQPNRQILPDGRLADVADNENERALKKVNSGS